MLLSSIFSACLRNGVTITQPRDRKDYYVLTKGENVLDFYVNSGEDYVGFLTYNSPQTDMQTDCNCNSYFHTIKHAMQFLNPTGEIAHPIRICRVETLSSAITGVSVSKNEEKNGIEIRFNEKPTDDIINTLKDKGFRWSPYNAVWWKKFNETDHRWASLTFCNADEPVLA